MSEDSLKVRFRGCRVEAALECYVDADLKVQYCAQVLAILKMEVANVVVADPCSLIITQVTLLIHFTGRRQIDD